MALLISIPQNVLEDLTKFVSQTHKYNGRLPNSLLIAQAFIMKYPDYGREYGLSAINSAIEYVIKDGFF